MKQRKCFRKEAKRLKQRKKQEVDIEKKQRLVQKISKEIGAEKKRRD